MDAEEHPWHVSLRATSTVLAANCWPLVGIAPSLSPTAGLVPALAPVQHTRSGRQPAPGNGRYSPFAAGTGHAGAGEKRDLV